MNTFILIPLLSSLLVGEVMAEDQGELVYKQLCSACHGNDGEGAGEGAFPPLNKSEWLDGSGDRAAQILLHGLTGPIDVAGKKFNLMMPAQGAASDKQKVDVINYVRKKWGPKPSKPYTIDQLKRAASLTKDRTEAWTAKELLSKYPFEANHSRLSELIVYEYKGKWEMLPDFEQLEPESVEEEHYGKISFRNIKPQKELALVWEGELEISKPAEYEFELNSSDGSRLVVNGVELLELNEVRKFDNAKLVNTKLDEGLLNVRVEFFNNRGSRRLSLRYRAVGDRWRSLSDDNRKKQTVIPLIDLTPKDGKTRIYNNFIANSTARAFAIGFPNQQNITFSTSNCGIDSAWKGKFISGGLHWTARGQGQAQPLGEGTVNLSLAKPTWFKGGKPCEVQFIGYKADETGNPTLKYKVDGVLVEEYYTAQKDGFLRSISINSSKPEKLELILTQTYDKTKPKNLSAGLEIEMPANATSSINKNVFSAQLEVGKHSNYKFNYRWTK